MKVLLLFFFMCAQTICTNAFLPFRKGQFNFYAVYQAIENKCANFHQLQEIFTEFSSCLHQSSLDYPITFDYYENNQEYCTYLKESEFRSCVKNLTTNLSPCLAEDEIYLQDLLLHAVDAGYEELCGIEGASNTQYLYNKINETRDCMEICGFYIVYYGSCTAKLNIFKYLDKGILNLNKHDFCHDLESLQKCTTNVLEGICNEEYSRMTDLIFRPFLEDCNDLNARK